MIFILWGYFFLTKNVLFCPRLKPLFANHCCFSDFCQSFQTLQAFMAKMGRLLFSFERKLRIVSRKESSLRVDFQTQSNSN